MGDLGNPHHAPDGPELTDADGDVVECECEHVSHFTENSEGEQLQHRTPATFRRETPYGVFCLCAACADSGHMPGQ